MQTFSEEAIETAAQLMSTADTARRFNLNIDQICALFARMSTNGTEPTGEANRILVNLDPAASPEQIADAFRKRTVEILTEDIVNSQNSK